MKRSPLTKTLVMACMFAAPVFTTNLHAQQIGVTWNPGSANPGLWSDPANWGGTVPVTGYKAFFNLGTVGPCVVDSAAGGCQISIGDGGGPCTIIVTNGGALSAGDTSVNPDTDAWTAIGQNNIGTMIIGNGGSVTFNYHLWIGLADSAAGTFTMNGGTASVAGAFGLGSPNGLGTSQVHINSGTLTLSQFNSTRSITGNSRFDIAGGTVLINGDHTADVNSYISAGKITAYGGTGNVNVDFNTINLGQTTLTASSGATPPQQKIASITAAGGNVTITYQTTPGFAYHLDHSTSLSPASWTPLANSATNATGSAVTFTSSQESAQQFYRSSSP